MTCSRLPETQNLTSPLQRPIGSPTGSAIQVSTSAKIWVGVPDGLQMDFDIYRGCSLTDQYRAIPVLPSFRLRNHLQRTWGVCVPFGSYVVPLCKATKDEFLSQNALCFCVCFSTRYTRRKGLRLLTQAMKYI